MRVLLDLYGTNHDVRSWSNPAQFQPERFQNREADLYNFIPQGGGNPFVTHRCPGEDIAVALMQQAARFLVESITYTVPKQHLNVNFARLPALLPDGFIISGVRLQ